MAVIEDQPETTSNGASDTPINPDSTTVPSKPKARLGPTEIVTIPNSDSEDDEDEGQVDGGRDGERGEEDLDFLKSYPDEIEVSPSRPITFVTSSPITLSWPRLSHYEAVRSL